MIGGPQPVTAGATAEATQQAEQSGGTPNIQSYWFTYDADNRVAISGGTLGMDGQIVVDDRAGSMEKLYDLAGNVVTKLTHIDTLPQTFNYSYDVRGERVGVTGATNPETRRYDADGRLIADVYTYAPGTWVSGCRYPMAMSRTCTFRSAAG